MNLPTKLPKTNHDPNPNLILNPTPLILTLNPIPWLLLSFQ